MLRIKRDDKIVVISGKDKGKTGKVIKVFPAEKSVVVENVNLIKKAVKKSDQYPQGGFIQLEKPLHISKVMLLDPKTNKAARAKVNVLKDGTKVRISKKSGEAF
ncbi:MAG: 50S ribosomal protein L24 [Candidatus Omnitrophica bacterium]|nr:50S ribosomal protein L24 [Candidatus Omnitrophota bacterium]